MDNIGVPDDLEIELPPGWIERSPPGEPKEFWASKGGSKGLLQVSKFKDEHFAFIAKQEDLGAFAAEIGTRLGTREQNWGKPAESKKGACAFGRFGFSSFVGGAYPALFLWVTVSSSAALMWTWLGPDPDADEAMQAARVVLEARQAEGRDT